MCVPSVPSQRCILCRHRGTVLSFWYHEHPRSDPGPSLCSIDPHSHLPISACCPKISGLPSQLYAYRPSTKRHWQEPTKDCCQLLLTWILFTVLLQWHLFQHAFRERESKPTCRDISCHLPAPLQYKGSRYTSTANSTHLPPISHHRTAHLLRQRPFRHRARLSVGGRQQRFRSQHERHRGRRLLYLSVRQWRTRRSPQHDLNHDTSTETPDHNPLPSSVHSRSQSRGFRRTKGGLGNSLCSGMVTIEVYISGERMEPCNEIEEEVASYR